MTDSKQDKVLSMVSVLENLSINNAFERRTQKHSDEYIGFDMTMLPLECRYLYCGCMVPWGKRSFLKKMSSFDSEQVSCKKNKVMPIYTSFKYALTDPVSHSI